MSRSLLKSVSLVSCMTLISRVLGFARDLIAAQLFGVNASVDAFYIAFKIPNFMRNLFAEGAFSQAFIPILADYQEKSSREETKVFISHIAGLLGSLLLIVTFFGVLWAQNLIMLFAPGLDEVRFHLSTEMLRITFPYLMLISLTAFAGAILNNYGKFGIPSFTPALLNISLIATAFSMSQWFLIPVKSQAWGILIGGFVQLFFQLAALYRIGFLVKPTLRWKDEGVQRVFKLILPSLFGASMGQLNILINTVFASFLITGSITWLYYSERLAYFPIGVFGVALATVILPHLSRQHASQSTQEFSSALDWGIRWNLIIGIPATITMFILSGPLIVSLFQYGKFTLHDVLMTQKSVQTYAIGLQAFMLNKLLSSAFYAKQNIATPVKLTALSIAANIILSYLLIGPLAHAGLALASSLASWINVVLLGMVLWQRKIYVLQSGWGTFIAQLVVANALLALFLWYCSNDVETWLLWAWAQRFFHLSLLGIGATLIYVGSFFIISSYKRI
jgi:putative peptidoglycan lipid II flippase